MVAIKVNGLPHQSIYPVSLLRHEEAFYLFPYRHLGGNPLRDVLIVGAGNGNDVAVALSQGARHVDAVEIDPVIQGIGAREHPDRPIQARIHSRSSCRSLSSVYPTAPYWPSTPLASP